MGGGMQAVRPQLLAQDPNRRLSAGQVEAYLYIWPVLATRAASPVRNPSHEMHDSLASVLLALGRWQRARRVQRLSDAARTLRCEKRQRWCPLANGQTVVVQIFERQALTCLMLCEIYSCAKTGW